MLNLHISLTLHDPFRLSSIINLQNAGWKVTVYQKVDKEWLYFGAGISKDLNEALTLAINDSIKFRKAVEIREIKLEELF